MAKISALTVLDAADGTETIPVLKGGRTMRMMMAPLARAMVPFLANYYRGDKGEMGGNVMSVGRFDQIGGDNGINVPGGTDLIQTSGATRGLMYEDTALTDADVAAHPLAIVKTKNGRYFRRDERELYIEMFGARSVIDKSFDSTPAILAAISYSGFCANRKGSVRGTSNGPTVYLGIGRFYMASRVNVKTSLAILGAGRGHILGGSASILAVEESGFLFERQDTLNFKKVAPTTGADGSWISGVQIAYVGPNKPRSGGYSGEFGIVNKCQMDIDNNYIHGFPGPGILTLATSGGDQVAQGEASCTRIRSNWIEECWVGYMPQGADANIIKVEDNTFSTCIWGICAQQFLSCTFINNHFKANGQLVHFEGKRYQPMPEKDDLWGTTQPGTDISVWGLCEAGGPTAAGYVGYDAIPTWTPNSTGYYAGGPVWHPSQNARSGFLFNYMEGGQPLPVINFPAVSIGGQWAHAEGATGRFLNFEQGSTNARSFVAARNEALPTVGKRTAIDWNGGLTLYSGDLAYGLSLQVWGKDFRFTQGNADYAMSAVITGDVTTQKFGRATTVPNTFWFAKGFAFGNRMWSSGSGPPASGSAGRGETIWLDNPTPGGRMSQICTTAGDVGSTAVFKAAAAIDA